MDSDDWETVAQADKGGKGSDDRSPDEDGGRYNAVRFTTKDGKTYDFSLDFLIERDAVIVDRVNGAPIKEVMNASNQLWIPGVPAKYYARDIVDIHLYHTDKPPVLDFDSFKDDGHDYTNRPNISVKAPFVGTVGVPMLFEGWAHDFDKRITAIKLSLDQGRTWTEYPLENVVAERVVTWTIAWTPTAPGTHQLMAKAVNEDGRESPIAAQHTFEVYE